MGNIIGITYDLKSDWIQHRGEPSDASAEFDSPETINNIATAFESAGHVVKRIGNVHSLLEQINDLKVDMVFNVCEGVSGRNREAQVPIILEMFGIPYVGSDGLTLALTLDKVVAKKIFVQAGIPTPKFMQIAKGDVIDSIGEMEFPLMVKAKQEGSSKGMSEHSRVKDMHGLKAQVERIHDEYDQAALVEEFICGTEFTVAVIGNHDPLAMPVAQVLIDGRVDLGDKFYTHARIASGAMMYVCPAKISEDLRRKLQKIAVDVYNAVECRDFGRVDFRVDEKGNPYVLEINPLPSLMANDVFNLFPKAIGSTYNKTLNQILNFALERYGLL
jgi:D-alanine-D-alanine ligase